MEKKKAEEKNLDVWSAIDIDVDTLMWVDVNDSINEMPIIPSGFSNWSADNLGESKLQKNDLLRTPEIRIEDLSLSEDKNVFDLPKEKRKVQKYDEPISKISSKVQTEEAFTINLDDLGINSNTTEVIPSKFENIQKIVTKSESVKTPEIFQVPNEVKINEVLPADRQKEIEQKPQEIDETESQHDISINQKDTYIDNSSSYDTNETSEWLFSQLTDSQKKRILRGLFWLMFLVLLFVAYAIFAFISSKVDTSQDILPVIENEVPKLSDVVDGEIPEPSLNNDENIDWDLNIDEPILDEQAELSYKEDLLDKLNAQKNELRTLLNKSLLVENFDATRLAKWSYQKTVQALEEIELDQSIYTSTDLEEITNRIDLYIMSVRNYVD